MPRPPEYDGLLKIGSFKEAVSNKDSIAQFLRTPTTWRPLRGSPCRTRPGSSSRMRGCSVSSWPCSSSTRCGQPDTGGHRATAIKRVAGDLKLDRPQAECSQQTSRCPKSGDVSCVPCLPSRRLMRTRCRPSGRDVPRGQGAHRDLGERHRDCGHQAPRSRIEARVVSSMRATSRSIVRSKSLSAGGRPVVPRRSALVALHGTT